MKIKVRPEMKGNNLGRIDDKKEERLYKYVSSLHRKMLKRSKFRKTD